MSSLALGRDGKVVVGGDFRVMGGESRYNIARFNLDGSLDSSFNPGAWFNGTVSAVAVRDDGGVVVGGSFTLVNGVPRSYLASLDADGNPAATFTSNATANGPVDTLVVLPSGDMLACGAFSAYGGDQNHGYLVKIFSDGSLDPSFSPGVNGRAWVVAYQPDGKILAGGDFTVVGGRVRNRIARFNPDGSLDTSFDPGAGPDRTVRALSVQPDGSVLIGGYFGTVNGGSWPYVARLNSQGLPDPSFATKVNSNVYALALQPDGKVFVGGNFTGGLMRLRTDGSTDPTFNIGVGANNYVNAVALQLDGNVVAGGVFTQFSGYNRTYLARLEGLSGSTGGEVEFSAAASRVSEAQPSVTLEVRRNGNNSSAVTVDYVTVSGTATAADYTPQSGKVIFAAGETKKNVTIPIRADAIVEDDEVFTVTLKNATGGAVLGAQDTATVTILNDDSPLSPGSLDGSFGSGISVGTGIYAISTAPEEKIVVGGDFRTIRGESHYNIARLNRDGSTDQSFNAAAWFNGAIYALSVDSSGAIIVGGAFTQVYGLPRAYLARLKRDGTMDDSFNPGAGPNSEVDALLLLADGSILLGGNFTSVNGDSAQTYLAKLLSDGSVDATFRPQVNGRVFAIATTGDGKIVLGGDFTSVGGQTRNRVSRLNSDGSLDASFDSGTGPNGRVGAIAIQPDGSIVLGGSFSLVNDKPHLYLARLNPTGAEDPSFTPVPNNYVQALAIDSSGNILAGGPFTQINSLPQGNFVRLKPDGTVDGDFSSPNTANGPVATIVQDQRGGVLVGGTFTQFAGINRNYFARINGVVLASSARINGLTITGNTARLSISAGRTGSYVLQSSSDCQTWTTLQSGSTVTPDFELSDSITAPQRFYRLLLP